MEGTSNPDGPIRREARHGLPLLDRERAQSLLAGENRLLEMVARGCALPVVLDALCVLVEQTASGCACSVLLVDASVPDAPTLRHGAAPSLPAPLVQAIDGRPVTAPAPWGPCAVAVEHGAQVIVADAAVDPRWQASAWSRLALSLGLRSCWSSPILSLAGQALGAFALYRREAGDPTPLEQDLIQKFTHIASIAIERAQNEAALRRSETFLAEAQRLSSTGSFSWRLADDVIVWSEQTYRIYQIDPGVPVTFDVVGTRLHPEEVTWFQQLLAEARRDGRDLEFEHRLQLPDGSVKHLHVVAHAALDANGQREYVGAVQDVTERRRSEDALGKVRAQLAHVARVTTLETLAASIAHEVSQPLTGIMTNAGTSLRMLATDPPNLDGVREAARRTMRDAARASDTISRLRAMFKQEGAAPGPLDLNEATREVLALSHGELHRARIIVRAELADDLPPVLGDRVQLQQVVLNLVLNAVEAMAAVEGGPRLLSIRTARDEGNQVRLTVADTGVGLEQSQLGRLFDAFYTTKREGMGIGLSVSRVIIEGHHGRLWAARNDGPGASFAFSIPRAPAPGPAER